MNTPNPLVPQGSLPNTRGKSHIRIAVITILAVHVVLLLALLMAGCKKTNDQASNRDLPPDNIPPLPIFTPDPTNPVPAPGNPTANVTPIAPGGVAPSPGPTPTPPVATSSLEGTEHTIIKGDSF